MVCGLQDAVAKAYIVAREESMEQVIQRLGRERLLGHERCVAPLFRDVSEVHYKGLMVFARQTIGGLEREVITGATEDNIVIGYVDGVLDEALEQPLACAAQFIGQVQQLGMRRVVIGGSEPLSEWCGEWFYTFLAVGEDGAGVSLFGQIPAEADDTWRISGRCDTVGYYEDAF